MKNNGSSRHDKLPVDEEDRQTQKEIKESVKKWRRATCYLGLAFVLSAGAWSLFFPGKAFHPFWQTWGRLLALTTLCTGLPWIYAAGTTLNLWLYGASLRKIAKDFASGNTTKYLK